MDGHQTKDEAFLGISGSWEDLTYAAEREDKSTGHSNEKDFECSKLVREPNALCSVLDNGKNSYNYQSSNDTNYVKNISKTGSFPDNLCGADISSADSEKSYARNIVMAEEKSIETLLISQSKAKDDEVTSQTSEQTRELNIEHKTVSETDNHVEVNPTAIGEMHQEKVKIRETKTNQDIKLFESETCRSNFKSQVTEDISEGCLQTQARSKKISQPAEIHKRTNNVQEPKERNTILNEECNLNSKKFISTQPGVVSSSEEDIHPFDPLPINISDVMFTFDRDEKQGTEETSKIDKQMIPESNEIMKGRRKQVFQHKTIQEPGKNLVDAVKNKLEEEVNPYKDRQKTDDTNRKADNIEEARNNSFVLNSEKESIKTVEEALIYFEVDKIKHNCHCGNKHTVITAKQEEKKQIMKTLDDAVNDINVNMRKNCHQSVQKGQPEMPHCLIREGVIRKKDEGKKYTNIFPYHSSSKSSVTFILDEALKNLQTENSGVQHNYLQIGRKKEEQKQKEQFYEQKSDTKGKPEPENGKTTKQTFYYDNSKKDDDIKTLDDALKYFRLSSRLQELEKSLEEVRRKKKSKEAHEKDFKQLDKEMQKLSFTFHPDKVKNRGGSEEETIAAQKHQTALNATRAVLNILNAVFLEDLSTDHRYGFYTNLNINLLGNEDEVKNRVYEVLFKIGMISEIKQQKIIAEIKKFLTESKSCIESYFISRVNDFKKYRDSALFHLKCCIKGYKNLRKEIEAVAKECKNEKLDNMSLLIHRMSNDSLKELTHLKQLKKVAKESLKGNFQIYSPVESMDDYFVLPLVIYTNVILMCNIMLCNEKFLRRFFPFPLALEPTYCDKTSYLMHPYYLASYFSGNRRYESRVMEIMGKEYLRSDGQTREYMNEKEIKSKFYIILLETNKRLEHNFKVDDYIEGSTKSHLMEDLKKCTTMMSDFQEKERELSKDIERFRRKTEEMDEKYDRLIKQNEEFNKKVKERLEQSKKLAERTSMFLSE